MATTMEHKPMTIDDEDLRCDVADELDFDPAIDATNVGVSVTDHTVTLGGTVHTYTEKIAAVKAARRVKGVHTIADEITVVPRSGAGISDAAIAAHIERLIEHSYSIPSTVKAVVSNGQVTLTGQVEFNYQRVAAAKALRDIKGVKWIDNSITLAPVATSADIRSKIVSAIHRNASVDANDVHVVVADGRVWLSGAVSSWAARRQAEDAAWSGQGVRDVYNNLTIR